MKVSRIFLFIIFSFLVCNQYQAQAIKNIPHKILSELNHQLDYKQAEDLSKLSKEIAINSAQLGALALVVFAMATIAHELGHAMIAELLFDLEQFPEIHIGTTKPDKDFSKKLFSLGNMHFYKKLWISGQTRFTATYFQDDATINAKWGIMTAAGGVSAALFLYGILSTIVGYSSFIDNKNLKKSIIKGLSHGYKSFTKILQSKKLPHSQKRLLINASFIIGLSFIFNIFYGLTPFLSTGDGIQLWEKHIGLTGTPLKCVRVGSIAAALTCWGLLIKNFIAAHKKLLAQQNDPQDRRSQIGDLITSGII